MDIPNSLAILSIKEIIERLDYQIQEEALEAIWEVTSTEAKQKFLDKVEDENGMILRKGITLYNKKDELSHWQRRSRDQRIICEMCFSSDRFNDFCYNCKKDICSNCVTKYHCSHPIKKCLTGSEYRAYCKDCFANYNTDTSRIPRANHNITQECEFCHVTSSQACFITTACEREVCCQCANSREYHYCKFCDDKIKFCCPDLKCDYCNTYYIWCGPCEKPICKECHDIGCQDKSCGAYQPIQMRKPPPKSGYNIVVNWIVCRCYECKNNES